MKTTLAPIYWLILAAMFAFLTAQASINENTRLSNLKASSMAGNLLGPSSLGFADVFVFKKAVTIPADEKSPYTVVRLSPVCSLSAKASKKTRLIKEGSSYGLFQRDQKDVPTIVKGYKRHQVRFAVSNASGLADSMDSLSIECNGLSLENSVGDLVKAAGSMIEIR